ncbi:MAG TPA: PsbP-related protein, partial [Chitinophagaceae bacterium]
KILILIFTMAIWNNLFSQKNITQLKAYINSENHYSIKYPANWKIEKNNEGIVSIESEKIKGGIYISVYNGITFPDDNMKNFILESNNLPAELEENILNGEENGIKSWYVSYTDSTNNLTCMLTYKRKGNYLLFVSTEIEPKLWKSGWKETMTEIILSIKLE